MKIRVAVLFGGHSVEHEVSIISGLQALAALDTAKYEAFPLYIAKDNGLSELLGRIFERFTLTNKSENEG